MSDDNSSSVTNRRRSTRNVSPKNYRLARPVHIQTTDSNASSESEFEGGEAVVRPELLFNEHEDLEGQQIFAFRTPKKRNALTSLADNAKTPKVVRQKLKQSEFPYQLIANR